jgi:hypothetical protein
MDTDTDINMSKSINLDNTNNLLQSSNVVIDENFHILAENISLSSCESSDYEESESENEQEQEQIINFYSIFYYFKRLFYKSLYFGLITYNYIKNYKFF